MKKEILFIHSAGPQGPYEGSNFIVNYLRKTLGPDYTVLYPKMPDPENPDYVTWRDQLSFEFSTLTGNTILIGHSLGGSVILKYLSEYDAHKSISGLFLIAVPYWGARDWEVDEFVLAKNFATKLRNIASIYLYHSKDDEAVPQIHTQYYAKKIPQATVRTFDNRGHLFSKGIPELVNDIRNLHPVPYIQSPD